MKQFHGEDGVEDADGHQPGARRPSQGTAAVALRDDDRPASYGLTLRLDACAGDRTFETWAHLPPAQVEQVPEPVPDGRYEATAALDGERRVTHRCRIGPRPAHTVVVEFGDDAVALTEGL